MKCVKLTQGILLPRSPTSSHLTLVIPLLCLLNLPFPIMTYPTMTNIQTRHPIGKGAAEARIPLLGRYLGLFHLSLACDQCRKTKSKCERSKTDDDPCKSCLAAGTGTPSTSYHHHQTDSPSSACTFLGIHSTFHPPPPIDRSYKRSELQARPS